MDTNPFATNPNAPQQQQQQTPDYLKPQPTGAGAGGVMGNVANMVKAIMAGNNQYKQQQQMHGATGQPQLNNPGVAAGAPGAPLSLAPPAQAPMDPGVAAGGVAQQAQAMYSDPAFANGAAPVNIDPVTQALMSPIPGVNNG